MPPLAMHGHEGAPEVVLCFTDTILGLIPQVRTGPFLYLNHSIWTTQREKRASQLR